MFSLVPMVIAFATGFLAGILWRQMRLVSLLIFFVLVFLVAGILNISIQIGTGN
jgi:hypothetical protein